jgi:hypothetical protein
VKIVGYAAHEVQSPPFSWVPWVLKWKEAKEHQVITEGEYFWVEENVSNGGLDKIMYGMFSTETFYHSSRRG